MSIRVISGIAKGRKLQMVPGDSTRPIMDKVKESLFNILGTNLVGASFLDLFAGTGAVGIEALSRGAGSVRFIDKDRKAIQTIRTNLEITGLQEHADVRYADALAYLAQPSPEAFEYIFVAPPQYKKLWKSALLKLDEFPASMAPDAIVVVQIDPKEREMLVLENLHLYDERRYGNTMLLFFEAVNPDEAMSSPE